MAFDMRFKRFKIRGGGEKRGYYMPRGKVITEDGEILNISELTLKGMGSECELSRTEYVKLQVFKEKLDCRYENGLYSKRAVIKDWERVLGEDREIYEETAKKWLDGVLRVYGYTVRFKNVYKSKILIMGMVVFKAIEPSRELMNAYLKAKLLGMSIDEFNGVPDVRESIVEEVKKCEVFSFTSKARRKYDEVLRMSSDGYIEHNVVLDIRVALTEKGVQHFWEDFQEEFVYARYTVK